jgi:glycosyltransferase involved in cell wall biosynthesis
MSDPILSIIIPTYRRGPILRECLRRIEKQTAKKKLEVIVVSDGKPDRETEALSKETWKVPVTFLSIPKSQQGAARNRGVKEAKGENVLFIGDDMLLESDACAIHLRRHEGAKIAVLSHITWDPALTITPVMRWLERTGWQFGYPSLAPYAHGFIPKRLQHRYTYTGNISLPTAIAREHPFLEGMTLYGWEDIEWGLRLREAEVPLFYEPDAKALHRHAMTLADSLKRMETLGRSAVLFEQIAPSLHIIPKGAKRFAYRALSLAPTLRGKHARAFLRGVEAQESSPAA